MKVKIRKNIGLKEAEKFSNILNTFTGDINLKSGEYCIDGKSMMGILAVMYCAKEDIYLDAVELDDEEMSKLCEKIADYIEA